MADLFDRYRVIDVDTHLTEPHDLWSSRAPDGYADRLPRVADVEGRPHWVLDGEVLGFATASGVVRPDGSKALGTDFFGWTIDDVHPGAYDMGARVEVMDQIGVHAQIIYPNLAGFGSQKFGQVDDVEVKRLCVSVYNDAMAEIHDRMPVILRPADEGKWLDPAITDPAVLSQLLKSYPSGLMEGYCVSRAVNAPVNDSPECIAPDDPPPTLLARRLPHGR